MTNSNHFPFIHRGVKEGLNKSGDRQTSVMSNTLYIFHFNNETIFDTIPRVTLQISVILTIIFRVNFFIFIFLFTPNSTNLVTTYHWCIELYYYSFANRNDTHHEHISLLFWHTMLFKYDKCETLSKTEIIMFHLCGRLIRPSTWNARFCI